MNKDYLKKLQEIRISKGLSFKQMADKLGISKCFYWQIENKKRNLTYTMALRIANVLNTTPDFIFYEEFKNQE